MHEIQYECPSIVINAGSYIIDSDNNSFSTEDQFLQDQKIIDQTALTIALLIKQDKMTNSLLLNEQNVYTKIYINDISSTKPPVYPLNANHIIDAQGNAAKFMIKAKYLQPQQKSHQQRDLLFFYQHKNNQKSLFYESEIIGNATDQQKILSYFGTDKKKIQRVKRQFNARTYEFKLQNFWESCGNQTHLLFICKTDKLKIIGAYSPLSHLWNQNQNNDDWWIKDNTKKSFIFSLKEDVKFELKDKYKAIYRFKDKSYISFGCNEFVICDQSDTNNDCQMFINQAYRNQKYQKSNPHNYDKEACISLNGNDSYSFKIEDWEAWKIQFYQ